MRKRIVIAAVVLVLLAAHAHADDERLGTWDGNVYTNTLADLTFHLPEGWTLDTTQFVRDPEYLQGSNMGIEDLPYLNSCQSVWNAYAPDHSASISLEIRINRSDTESVDAHFKFYDDLIAGGERFTKADIDDVVIGGHAYRGVYLSEKYDSRAEFIRDIGTHRIMISLNAPEPFDYTEYMAFFE